MHLPRKFLRRVLIEEIYVLYVMLPTSIPTCKMGYKSTLLVHFSWTQLEAPGDSLIGSDYGLLPTAFYECTVKYIERSPKGSGLSWGVVLITLGQ